SVAAIKHEVLPAEEFEVRIGIADADPLVAWDSHPPATAVDPRPHARIALPWRHIDHAKAPLGGAPNVTIVRRDELVGSVVPEVVMVMARCEFEQPVVGGDVHVGIADEDIGIADVRRRHSEPQHPMVASGHASFDHAAGGSRKGLVVNDPAMSQSLTF